MDFSPLSPLVKANERFVRQHLQSRWFDINQSSDSRSHKDQLRDAARQRGLGVQMLGQDALFFRGERCIGGLQGMRPSVNGIMAGEIATSKALTASLLKRGGVPTPEGRSFRVGDIEEARVYLRESATDTPYVVKPTRGRQGRGVTTGVASEADLQLAWEKAVTDFNAKDILVEKEVPGVDIRVYVVGGVATAAAARIPPFIVGDGASNLSSLIDILTESRERHAYMRRLKLVPDYKYLERTGVTMATVLERGCIQFLNGTANLSQGGVAVDVTNQVAPQILRMGEGAAHQVPGLAVGGVDILSPDIASQKGAKVIEINSWANILPHMLPAFGQSRDVAGAIIDEMLRLAGVAKKTGPILGAAVE